MESINKQHFGIFSITMTSENSNSSFNISRL